MDGGSDVASWSLKSPVTEAERWSPNFRTFEVVDVEITISGIPVRGIEIDARTGCAHYRSELDIIAVKFNCCRMYYSCSRDSGEAARRAGSTRRAERAGRSSNCWRLVMSAKKWLRMMTIPGGTSEFSAI
jgi:uncharacterized CHY-type Zn-finger protein